MFLIPKDHRHYIAPKTGTYFTWLLFFFILFFFNSSESDHMNLILASCPSLLNSHNSIIIKDKALMLHVRRISVIAAVPREADKVN